MNDPDRFYIIFQKHIGFGIRWESFFYQLEISIAFPFFAVIIGLGKKLQ